jgi:pimeloyl-ACP methyl ester carboxylesterase
MECGVSEYPVDIAEVHVSGMDLRCRLCGPEGGEPVLLLHGFPESSAMWVPTMRLLAAKGYRCVAPDQRGYSPGARPRSAGAYTMRILAGDVLALADAFGFARFHLVGHDWGAACGWTVVQLHPERLLSWTALSVPHMASFGKALRTDREQRKKSRYLLLFQLPVLPELMLGSGVLERLWKGASHEEREDYRALLGPYAARRAALNWYRGARQDRVAYGDVSVPTLMIWGNRDIAIARAGVLDTARHMKGEYELLELDAGHWIPRAAFDAVMSGLVDHLARHPER